MTDFVILKIALIIVSPITCDPQTLAMTPGPLEDYILDVVVQTPTPNTPW